MLCQEVTVQDLAVKGPARDVVWVEVRARVEAEWAGHLLPDLVVVVYVRTADTVSHTLQASPVTSKAVQSVGRE